MRRIILINERYSYDLHFSRIAKILTLLRHNNFKGAMYVANLDRFMVPAKLTIRRPRNLLRDNLRLLVENSYASMLSDFRRVIAIASFQRLQAEFGHLNKITSKSPSSSAT